MVLAAMSSHMFPSNLCTSIILEDAIVFALSHNLLDMVILFSFQKINKRFLKNGKCKFTHAGTVYYYLLVGAY